MKPLVGNLSLKTAIVGQPVICIVTPKIDLWESLAELQFFTLPQAGHRYFVRSNARVGVYSGILLATENRNGRLIALANPGVLDIGEPFFAYNCFDVTNRP